MGRHKNVLFHHSEKRYLQIFGKPIYLAVVVPLHHPLHNGVD